MEEKKANSKKKDAMANEGVRVNPLRNEKVFVRFIPRTPFRQAENKRHVAYGGKMDDTYDTICVPVLRSTGNYKNVLTNDEKDYLEEALGLDYNALSIYGKNGVNYWDNCKIQLTKEGLHLDLSDPEQYIKYKVLLANTDKIAPSVDVLQERPEVTFRYVIVREVEESKLENAKMDAIMQSYTEFKKVAEDLDTLRVLLEIMDGRPYGPGQTKSFLHARVNQLIQADAREFLRQITDPLLHSKVIIRVATELGKLSKKGDYYFLRSDNSPLCNAGENPTLSIAARYINEPIHQDIKFLLESEVDKAKS